MKFPLVTRMTAPSFDGARAGADPESDVDAAAAGAIWWTLAVDWLDMMTSQVNLR